MKDKTFATFSDGMLKNERILRDTTDLELINSAADDLNSEAEDILSYQVAI